MKFSENGLMPIADYSQQYDFDGRGRDGFIIFVPNEIGMRSTYEVLKWAGGPGARWSWYG